MADISKIQLSDDTQYNLKDAVARSLLTENDTSTGDISKIQLSDNTQYNIKDAQAREDIETITTDVKAQVNADKDLINNGTAFIDDETLDDYDDCIEDMQEAYKKFIPIQSESGTTEVTIDNTGDAKALTSVQIDGNTTQFTTTGKNLLRFDLAYLKTKNTGGTWSNNVYSHNGLTLTINDDNTIVVNGKSTAQETFFINQEAIYFPTGTYYLSGAPNGSNTTYDIRIYNYNNAYGVLQEFTGVQTVSLTNANQDYNLSIVVRSGQTLNNVKFYPMFATNNDTTYEPYTGRNSKPQSFISSKHQCSNWRKYNKCSRKKFNKSEFSIYRNIKWNIDNIQFS